MDPVASMPDRHRRADARAGRHRLDDGPEGECGRWLADYLRGRGFVGRRAAGRRHAVQRHGDAPRRAARSCCRPTSTACRRSFRAASRATGSTAAASCDAKGILAAQVAAAERLRRDGETRVGLRVRRRRGARQRRRPRRRTQRRRDGCRFLINGEPTDNRLGLATRGILRLRLRATRPRRAFVVSRARRVGDRQADRRAGRAARRSRCRPIRCSAGRTTPSV